jgi:tetratricopeptide (TPR) repeat protein
MNYLSNVIKTNKKMHPYLFHLYGNFLMHHVQFQKAIKEFERANIEFHNLYKSNGFSFSNYNIGLCYEKLGKVEEAVKYYEKSVINLNSAEALNALGHAQYSLFEEKKDKKRLELA